MSTNTFPVECGARFIDFGGAMAAVPEQYPRSRARNENSTLLPRNNCHPAALLAGPPAAI